MTAESEHPDVVLCPAGPMLLRGDHVVEDAEGRRHRTERPVSAVTRRDRGVPAFARRAASSLPIVAARTDGAVHGPQDPENSANDDQDDADRPHDRDVENRPEDQQDDAQDDHVEPSALFGI